jgi:M6 family metalloprotease-like protein
MRPSTLFVLAAGTSLVLGAAAAPQGLQAQDVEMRGRVHGVRPPPGYYEVLASDPTAYRFQEVWKDIARQVRERRQELARAGDYATLNAHLRNGPSRAAAQAAGLAVTGTFRIPVLVGVFKDSTHNFLPDTAGLNSKMFRTSPAPPYSITTFYDEVSNSLLTVTGDVIGWFAVDSASTWYQGSNNGLNPATDKTGDFIQELLAQADPLVDFSQYDNDSNGTIDLVAVLHPLRDGACGGVPHIWAHRWVLAAWLGSTYTTGDGVTANDYVIQSAVGGNGGCTDTDTMEVGTMSHELGHGMAGLPDLYDTSGNSEGIGEWGLMGSGNWNVQSSPAHMEAWSKDQVGWIAVDTVNLSQGTGANVLRPIIPQDTALRIEIGGTNEYFFLENRQGFGSEAGNINGQGLLIWHIDPDRIAARRPTNSVNAVVPHGVDLEQADGLDHLGNNVNRGDSGDPWPGTSGKTSFDPSSAPNSELNDNSNSALRVDSITQNPDGSVAFRINFNVVSERITTSVGAGTQVTVDASPEAAPYDAVWVFPSSHTIAVDSIQGDTLVRYVFQSWSDAGARSHSVTADATPDTFTANLQTEHRLRATADIQGSVSSTQTLDGNGIAWLLPTDNVALQATATAQDFFFVEWSGDTTTTNDTLSLAMDRPWTVNAEFGAAVAIETSALQNGVMGAGYTDTLSASGGSGSYTWSLTGGDPLPVGLTLNPSGSVSGVPEEDGSFQLVVQAVSGALSREDTIPLSITRPVLSLDNVVNQLLSPVGTLTPEEQRFLDLIGNDNGNFDIGDFRAYLQDAGVVTDVVPAEPIKAPETARKEEGR